MSEELGLQSSANLPFYETNGIFADHYLRKLPKNSDLWPSDNVVEDVYAKCEAIISKRGRSLARYSNESQTRLELIDKVLDALGFYFIPENPSPGVAKTTPDYLLFATEDDKDLALSKDPKVRYTNACSLLEAKRYGHHLGAVSRTETPGRFPHHQIRDYLQDSCDTDGKSYFNWAILTNGSKWRLYHRNTPTTSFFEINFEEVLTSKHKFKYFYVLFHSTAFQVDDDGQCLLDRLREESLEHQAELESNLRKRIFALLETLANGFYNHEPNELTKDHLHEIYEASLIFLYRLLFVLFAEGRGLLPVKQSGIGSNKHYRKRFSLARFVNSLKGSNLSKEEDDFADTYKKLLALFDLINGSSKQLNKRCNVPLYNGGLFDPEQYQNLLKWRVGDYTLERVLKGLLFVPIPSHADETDPIDYKETIDYADLEVRQLGSIYEGLLEYRLVLKNGSLQLMPESGERKSSGSYYTPDYIVMYIVNQTIQPLIDRIEQSEAVQSALSLKVQDNSFANAVMNFRLLDPAMGSGHFLVRATERLAFEIASHPTTRLAIEDIPPGLSHEMAELSYWRRRVVESSIYGVDLNLLAVELAKLSLWLTCISSNQPLNFLDHHLRCGNSLVGTKINELNGLPNRNEDQVELFEIKNLDSDLHEAVESLSYIRETISSDIAVVKGKENKWKLEVHDRLAPFRAIADLRNSFEFGLKLDGAIYKEIANDLIGNRSDTPSEATMVMHGEIWDAHLKLKRQYHYFHWELEFPDAFDTDEDMKGFDAVMGNPPYVRGESFKESKEYLAQKYEVYTGSSDLYTYFIEKALLLLCSTGHFGMITSNKWLRANYGYELRNHISSNYAIKQIVDFGSLPVFPGVSTFPSMIIISNGKKTDSFLYAPIKELHPKQLEEDVERISYPTTTVELHKNIGWTLGNTSIMKLLEKIVKVSTPLEGHLGDIHIKSGIKTGLNAAFIVDKRTRDELVKQDRRSKEIIVPFIIGENVRKYFIDYREKYLILTRIGIDIEKYPAIFKHLSQFQERLDSRWDKGNHWWELRPCDYYDIFELSKIIYPEITSGRRFSWEEGYFYSNNKTFMIPNGDKSLLGLLNSNVVWCYLIHVCSCLGDFQSGGGVELRKIHVDTIPIPSEFHNKNSKKLKIIETSVEQLLKLNKDLRKAVFASDITDIENEIAKHEKAIDHIVYDLYGLTDDEIKLIEETI